MLDDADIRTYFDELRGELERRQELLDRLDGAGGDGDHGATMVMGLRAVTAALTSVPAGDVGALLREAAAAFASVGGSIGPLWGTALLRASQVTRTSTEVDGTAIASMLTEAVAGIAHRGRSAEGDKTLLDVMGPAARAFEREIAGGAAVEAAFDAGLDAAREGLRRCAALPAKRGRASRSRTKAIGTPDPGAASAFVGWSVAARLLGRGTQDALLDELPVTSAGR